LFEFNEGDEIVFLAAVGIAQAVSYRQRSGMGRASRGAYHFWLKQSREVGGYFS